MRNVRNFWVEAEADGRQNAVALGPSSKDGGIHVRVLIRRDGGIDTAAVIRGVAFPDGTLELIIVATKGEEVLGRLKVESTR